MSYKCPYCYSEFDTADGLKRHLESCPRRRRDGTLEKIVTRVAIGLAISALTGGLLGGFFT